MEDHTGGVLQLHLNGFPTKPDQLSSGDHLKTIPADSGRAGAGDLQYRDEQGERTSELSMSRKRHEEYYIAGGDVVFLVSHRRRALL